MTKDVDEATRREVEREYWKSNYKLDEPIFPLGCTLAFFGGFIVFAALIVAVGLRLI